MSEWTHSSLGRGASAAASDEPVAAAASLSLTSPEATDACPLPPFGAKLKDVRASNGRVSVSVTMDASVYVLGGNGGELSGRVRIDCTRDRGLRLGDIQLHVTAFEETLGAGGGAGSSSSSSSSSHRRLFLARTLFLQAPHLAPSEAVRQEPPDENGMWAAVKGVTTFPFRIRFDAATTSGLPSSFWNKKFGGVRYIVAATCKAKVGNTDPHVLAAYREPLVLEHAPNYMGPVFPQVSMLTSSASAVVGGFLSSSRGEVVVSGYCHVPECGQESGTLTGAWVSGGVGFVTVDIRNSSKKDIRNIKIALIRRLKTFSRAPNPSHHVVDGTDDALTPIHFSRTVIATKTYAATKLDFKSGLAIINAAKAAKGWSEGEKDDNIRSFWHGVPPGDHRKVLLDIGIPYTAYSVRFGVTVDVSYIVQISVCPRGAKPIVVEIPVSILHPASLYASLPRLFASKHALSATHAEEPVEIVRNASQRISSEVVSAPINAISSSLEDDLLTLSSIPPSVLDRPSTASVLRPSYTTLQSTRPSIRDLDRRNTVPDSKARSLTPVGAAASHIPVPPPQPGLVVDEASRASTIVRGTSGAVAPTTDAADVIEKSPGQSPDRQLVPQESDVETLGGDRPSTVMDRRSLKAPPPPPPPMPPPVVAGAWKNAAAAEAAPAFMEGGKILDVEKAIDAMFKDL